MRPGCCVYRGPRFCSRGRGGGGVGGGSGGERARLQTISHFDQTLRAPASLALSTLKG